jgi:flagellin-like protein
MVFKKLFSEEKAVTPVIGVMLMVVVTVILAAAVSSYAGSMSTQDAAPQATLKASASYADGCVTLEHLGGDILAKANMNIEIAYGNPTTSGYVEMANVTFSPEANFLRPGDVATIPFDPIVDWTGVPIADFKDGTIDLAVYVGTPFKVSIIDKESGQTVYTSTVVMNP